ncbi:hypothetical protein BC826DRAFT_1072213 [Russula brevipes]|nr:hypothetical protein BC826DRAFT_1072213 [Russula brevipes]
MSKDPSSLNVSATLRPYLKHSSDLDSPAPTNSPLPFALCSSALRVHFPPTPGLCQTHLTHSSAIYDRHPIVVSPNACVLPERNERTYLRLRRLLPERTEIVARCTGRRSPSPRLRGAVPCSVRPVGPNRPDAVARPRPLFVRVVRV